ncbi:hypothetical protein OXYTRIMIC_275 [Oxytricha trifallax]|uniref:Uncharacterized protein n=1 Tax=Oxytricha trifallax TaxID=1172189 RepID=A0A073HY76_9SPIT|nr:hypothetical protein OXYTRIMIC_275 [Oxytricha trifallax]
MQSTKKVESSDHGEASLIGKRKREDPQPQEEQKDVSGAGVQNNNIINHGNMINVNVAGGNGQIIINLCNCFSQINSGTHQRGEIFNFDAIFKAINEKDFQKILVNLDEEVQKQFQQVAKMLEFLQKSTGVARQSFQDKLCMEWLYLILENVVNHIFFGNKKQILLEKFVRINSLSNNNLPLFQFNGSAQMHDSIDFYPETFNKLTQEDAKIQLLKQLIVDFQNAFSSIFCCTGDFTEKITQALSILQEYKPATKHVKAIHYSRLSKCYLFKFEDYLGETSVQKFQESISAVVHTIDKLMGASTEKKVQAKYE